MYGGAFLKIFHEKISIRPGGRRWMSAASGSGSICAKVEPRNANNVKHKKTGGKETGGKGRKALVDTYEFSCLR